VGKEKRDISIKQPLSKVVVMYMKDPQGSLQYSLLSFSLTIYSCKIRPYRIFIA
jgi:hypothetical protein